MNVCLASGYVMVASATGTQTRSAAWDLHTMQSSTKRQPKRSFKIKLLQFAIQSNATKMQQTKKSKSYNPCVLLMLVWSLDEGAKASWAGRVRSGTFPYIMGYYYIKGFWFNFAQCLRSVLPTQQKSAIFLQFSGIIWNFLEFSGIFCKSILVELPMPNEIESYRQSCFYDHSSYLDLQYCCVWYSSTGWHVIF